MTCPIVGSGLRAAASGAAPRPAVARLAPAGLGLIGLLCAALPGFAQMVGPTPQPAGVPIAPEDAVQAPTEDWAIHAQSTLTTQFHPGFPAAFSGSDSLKATAQARETFDLTLYGGVRPWNGAEFWVNPEVDQGFGLSNTVGAAGFPSGEAYRVGEWDPYARLPRVFLRQTIDLGGEPEKVDSDLNQLAMLQTADRLVLTLGKFSVVDVFDTNKYAHDPRNDFLNWSVIDAGTFDYAADAWGFTYGGAVEWYQDWWTVRTGLFDLSSHPNTKGLDTRFPDQYQLDEELEERHALFGEPGKLKLLGFLSHGRMGSYNAATELAIATGQPADIAAVRVAHNRGGISLNLEQQIADDLGGFARAGWAQGQYEAFEFTDIDKTVSAGLSLQGKRWDRPDDTVGLALAINDASAAAKRFFAAGGLGILVGDGALIDSGAERVVEAYYSFAAFSWARLSVDYQFIDNPAYNRDRGPVSVFGARLHVQF
ncbi:MAG TPA: carbohydrate porin [Stellaceae bacterium]|nr:carbohydrate porin [Stellaceae bacterium]